MANSAWEALVLLLGCSLDLHQELKMNMFKFSFKTFFFCGVLVLRQDKELTRTEQRTKQQD